MRISIIGAGPAGCYTAYLLAKAGAEVSVYEEHPIIGEPLHCAGIVTNSIKKIIDIPESIIINKISKARIYAPNNTFIEFNLKNQNLILDRIKFDQWLGHIAQDTGAHFFFKHTFVDYKNKEVILKYKETLKKIKTDYVVGADGPCSAVAKSIGEFKNRKFWQGIQARVKLINQNIVEFYPHIGTFAWIIPEDKSIVRIGLLAKKDTYAIFKKFLEEKAPRSKLISKQAGLVPYYNSSIKTQKRRVYLVGDAATQVKATSGGGIIQGLIASQCVAKALVQHQDYEQLWRKKLALDLWIHLKIRKILDKFSAKDYNYLVNLINQKKIKKILQEFDRDYPAKFMLQMAVNEPRFLLFIKKII